MNCPKEENSALTTGDLEELDYEEDDASTKKFPLVSIEKEQDVEDGEISDADGQNFICAVYKSGMCHAGDKCPFFHVTDKGLYKMFDAPSNFEFQNVHLAHPSCNVLKETASSAWEKALLKAKRLVKERDLRVKRTCDPVVIAVENDREQCSTTKPSRPKPRRYRSPEALPRKASLSDSLSDSPKRKSIENRDEWFREIKWQDPWRRSPVRYSKSSAVSSKRSRRKSSSSSPDHKIRLKDRKRRKNYENRYRVKSSRSSSRSRSPVSMGRSRKEKFKRDTRMQEKKVEQEKKVTPSVSKMLDKNPKVVESKEKPPSITFVVDKSERETKPLCARQGKKTSPTIDNKPLKQSELVNMKPPSLNHHSGLQFNDASQRTQKKPKAIKPIPDDSKIDNAPVQSSSDMSISPLSDSSLSDLFDPDKKAGKIDKTLRVSRPRSFPARKTCDITVPPENKIVNSFQMESKLSQSDGLLNSMNSAEVKPEATPSSIVPVNKVIDLPKPKAMKKRNIDSLEDDLLKFQRGYRIEPSQSVPTKCMQSENTVQSNTEKSTEAVENCMPKNGNLSQNEKVEEDDKDQRSKKAPLTRSLTRKEVLLKQLHAINAAIEKKKKLCGDANVTKAVNE